MYCVKCGVELQKGVKACPLCGTRVFHPDIDERADPAPYPPYAGDETVSHGGALFIVSVLFAIPLVLSLLIDLQLHRHITWSGYVMGGLLLGYLILCLPLWFRRRNPVVFFPIAAVGTLLFLVYVCLKTGGRWFLPFALPLGGGVLLIAETVIVLLRYAVGSRRHRWLYIIGGALIATGGLCVLIEFLLKVTFGATMRWWSLYPLIALFLLGMMLIVIGICRPLRESLHKRFFI